VRDTHIKLKECWGAYVKPSNLAFYSFLSTLIDAETCMRVYLKHCHRSRLLSLDACIGMWLDNARYHIPPLCPFVLDCDRHTVVKVLFHFCAKSSHLILEASLGIISLYNNEAQTDCIKLSVCYLKHVELIINVKQCLFLPLLFNDQNLFLETERYQQRQLNGCVNLYLLTL